MRDPRNWKVVQNGLTIVMNLTRHEADTKVWNEERIGNHMEARLMTVAELHPLPVDTETIDSWSDVDD